MKFSHRRLEFILFCVFGLGMSVFDIRETMAGVSAMALLGLWVERIAEALESR